jgi:hypothetical protein
VPKCAPFLHGRPPGGNGQNGGRIRGHLSPCLTNVGHLTESQQTDANPKRIKSCPYQSAAQKYPDGIWLWRLGLSRKRAPCRLVDSCNRHPDLPRRNGKSAGLMSHSLPRRRRLGAGKVNAAT